MHFNVYYCDVYIAGGLGFSLREIGLALTIAGVVFLPFSLFLYPLVSDEFCWIYPGFVDSHTHTKVNKYRISLIKTRTLEYNTQLRGAEINRIPGALEYNTQL